MWLFPKHHYKWKEPKAFRKEHNQLEASKLRWWYKPIASLIVTCFLMEIWWMEDLNNNNKRRTIQEAIILALLAGPFMIYFFDWLYSLVPRTIQVFDTCLCHSQGEFVEKFQFKDIQSFLLHDCVGYHVMALEIHGGKQRLLGIPQDVDLAGLVEFFRSRGVLQIQDAVSSDHL